MFLNTNVFVPSVERDMDTSVVNLYSLCSPTHRSNAEGLCLRSQKGELQI